MFFFLKKFFGTLLMPLPTALAAFALAGILVWLTRNRFSGFGGKLAKLLCTFGFCWLVVFSNTGVSTLLLQHLENQYPPLPEFSQDSNALPADLKECKYVMVLGGGADFQDQKERNALGRLSAQSNARLAEGIRVLRALPDAKLIVSGESDDPKNPSGARETEVAALSLGVPASKIIRFDDTRDTRGEIESLKKLAGDTRVALVTSANHLPRGMVLCRELQVDVVPCPADYRGRPSPVKLKHFFRWDAGSLQNSAYCFHEWLGRLV